MILSPYLVVNLVLEIISLILFCMTGAALLSKYPLANRYLPARLRARRRLPFVAQGLVLFILSIGILLVVAKGRPVFLVALPTFELFFCLGLANSVVLTYKFLDGRFLRNTPMVPRRLLFAVCAVVMVTAAAIALYVSVVRLFLLR